MPKNCVGGMEGLGERVNMKKAVESCEQQCFENTKHFLKCNLSMESHCNSKVLETFLLNQPNEKQLTLPKISHCRLNVKGERGPTIAEPLWLIF